jgi:hypothetical protein
VISNGFAASKIRAPLFRFLRCAKSKPSARSCPSVSAIEKHLGRNKKITA